MNILILSVRDCIHTSEYVVYRHRILTSIVDHTTALFSLSDHYILSRVWRVIADQVQTNYHGRVMVLKSVRCDRAVDNE